MWLDETVVAGVIGAELVGDVDVAVLTGFVEAVRTYVESRRPELFVADVTPAAHIVVAASMLAYRCYRSRTAPEAELGKTDDLSAMLGLGKHRRFRFGGAAVLPSEV